MLLAPVIKSINGKVVSSSDRDLISGCGILHPRRRQRPISVPRSGSEKMKRKYGAPCCLTVRWRTPRMIPWEKWKGRRMIKEEQITITKASKDTVKITVTQDTNKADRHKSRARDTTSHYAKKSKAGQTDGPTDRRTDTVTCRVACTRLKTTSKSITINI